jgi:hypothetical protein
MSHGPAPLMAQLHKALAAHGHRTGTAACTARAAHYRSGAVAQHARRPERIARAPAWHDGAALRGGGAARPTALEEKAVRRGAAEAMAWRPYRWRAKRGQAARRWKGRSAAVLGSGWARRPTHGEEAASATAGRRSAAASNAAEGGGTVKAAVAARRSDTHGRERGCGFRPDCRDGAAGRRFMARARVWQCCHGSRCQVETEL